MRSRSSWLRESCEKRKAARAKKRYRIARFSSENTVTQLVGLGVASVTIAAGVFPLSAYAAIPALILGAALFLKAHKEGNRALDVLGEREDKKQRIKEGLIALIASGCQLRDKCPEMGDACTEAAREWQSETQAFLRQELGEAYCWRLESNHGILSVNFAGVTEKVQEALQYFYGRLIRLDEFLKENEGL